MCMASTGTITELRVEGWRQAPRSGQGASGVDLDELLHGAVLKATTHAHQMIVRGGLQYGTVEQLIKVDARGALT